MPQSFALCEPYCKRKVRTMRNDLILPLRHHVRMVRKISGPAVWYAKEWIKHKGLRQADIVSRTPFNKGQVSEYVNGSRRWNADVLAEFANAIGVEPPDLLRPPHDVENDLALFLQRMDQRKRAQAMRLIRALDDAA